MPELSIIKTIKNIVEPQIQGLTIENVLVNRPEIIAHPTADEFCEDVTGQVIGSMARRGKFLIINIPFQKTGRRQPSARDIRTTHSTCFVRGKRSTG